MKLTNLNLTYHSLRCFEEALTYEVEPIFNTIVVDKKRDTRRYSNIPSSYTRFEFTLRVLSEICPEARPSFLDVGCGVGFKVRMALTAGWKAEGLEIQRKYSRYHWGLHIKYANAIKVRADYYRQFDIIYMYQPMAGEAGLGQLINHVVTCMKPGAYLIYAGWMSNDAKKIKTLTKVIDRWTTRNEHGEFAYDVYQKPLTTTA